MEIIKATGINQGHLSTLVKNLKEAKLVTGEGKHPRLAIQILPNFFETQAKAKG
ncbi:MAG TPA: hypothetical protein VL200_05845 [Lacunisphaera sp.]|nr:hypothetical protein [Lacunisphaera sp.]